MPMPSLATFAIVQIRSPKKSDEDDKDFLSKYSTKKSMHERMKNFRSIDFDPLENAIEEPLKRSRSAQTSRNVVRLKW